MHIVRDPTEALPCRDTWSTIASPRVAQRKVAIATNQVEEQVARKKEAATVGGGKKRIDAQHAKGKLTARERLALLLDEDSFVEECMFMESRSDTSQPVLTSIGVKNAILNLIVIFRYLAMAL